MSRHCSINTLAFAFFARKMEMGRGGREREGNRQTQSETDRPDQRETDPIRDRPD